MEYEFVVFDIELQQKTPRAGFFYYFLLTIKWLRSLRLFVTRFGRLYIATRSERLDISSAQRVDKSTVSISINNSVGLHRHNSHLHSARWVLSGWLIPVGNYRSSVNCSRAELSMKRNGNLFLGRHLSLQNLALLTNQGTKPCMANALSSSLARFSVTRYVAVTGVSVFVTFVMFSYLFLVLSSVTQQTEVHLANWLWEFPILQVLWSIRCLDIQLVDNNNNLE